MTLLQFSPLTAAKVVDDSSLELHFSDGTQHLVSVEPYLQKAKPGGVFEPLKDPAYFALVR